MFWFGKLLFTHIISTSSSLVVCVDCWLLKMQTYSINTHRQWPSPKHPFPTKPLPPIPLSTYLVLEDHPVDGYLLSHLVPSPSLQFDGLFIGEDQDTKSSKRSSISSQTDRDSLDSFMESYASLLPHSTCSDQTSIPQQQTMDSSTVGSWCHSTSTLCTDPVIKTETTAEPLDVLSMQMSGVHLGRRDSAIFDTTQPACNGSSNAKINVINSQSRSIKLDCFAEFNLHFDSTNTPSSPVQQVEPQGDRLGGISFMEWDDETPRLAKMKKSIADLKSAARTRSNSLPLAPLSVASSGSGIDNTTVATRASHPKVSTFNTATTGHTKPTKRSSCGTVLVKSFDSTGKSRNLGKPLPRRKSLGTRRLDIIPSGRTSPKQSLLHTQYNPTIRVVGPSVPQRRSSSQPGSSHVAATAIGRRDSGTSTGEVQSRSKPRSTNKRKRGMGFTRWVKRMIRR